MAMLLTGENNTEFELGLIEETLEDEIQDGEGDDTTLTLSFRVVSGDDSWEETAPCLNAFEVTNLAEWLEGVVGERPDIPELEMLEPELRFSVVGDRGDKVTLRIDFHITDRPETHRVNPDADTDHIDIKLSRTQVHAAAQELRRDLEELRLTSRSGGGDNQELGEVVAPGEDLNMIDDVEAEPEGMGDGEDNAGER